MVTKKTLGWTIPAGLGLMVAIFAATTIGINDAGYRTVIQYPSGQIVIKFDPGWYFDFGGRTTVYKDVLTFDFEIPEGQEGRLEAGTVGAHSISVRYQDGGLGDVHGKVQFSLPDDDLTMLEVHSTYRSNAGLANKLLVPVSRESAQQAAGLMTSEEAYAERRSDYGNFVRDQIRNGKYRTVLTDKTVEVATGRLDALGIPIMDEQVTKVPIIATDETGAPIHERSAIDELGIALVSFQITDWDFEPRTLEQIQTKRTANMAIITAQANANKAEFQKLEVIAEGQKSVEQARYEELEVKTRQIVIAERDAEKLVIAATAIVNVNEQNAFAAAEDLKAAKLEKLAAIARGEGQARAKELIMLADGQLQIKLDAYVDVNNRYAQAIEKVDTWVPQIVMGGNGDNSGGMNAMTLIELLGVRAAKDLSLDMDMSGGKD